MVANVLYVYLYTDVYFKMYYVLNRVDVLLLTLLRITVRYVLNNLD